MKGKKMRSVWKYDQKQDCIVPDIGNMYQKIQNIDGSVSIKPAPFESLMNPKGKHDWFNKPRDQSYGSTTTL